MGSRHGEWSALGALGWWAPGAEAAFSPAVQRTVLEDGELLLHRLREIRQVSGPLTVLATVPPCPALGPIRFLTGHLFRGGGDLSTDPELSEGWGEDPSSTRCSSALGLPRVPPGCVWRGLALCPPALSAAPPLQTSLRQMSQTRFYVAEHRAVVPHVSLFVGGLPPGLSHQEYGSLLDEAVATKGVTTWTGLGLLAPGPQVQGGSPSEQAVGAAGQGRALLPFLPRLLPLSRWFPTQWVSSAPGCRLGQPPEGLLAG